MSWNRVLVVPGEDHSGAFLTGSSTSPPLSCLNLNFTRCSVGYPGLVGINKLFQDHESGVVRGFSNAYSGGLSC